MLPATMTRPNKGSALRDDGLQAGERNLANELTAENARKNAKDLFLKEAVNILGDELEVLPTGSEFAVRVKPVPAAEPN